MVVAAETFLGEFPRASTHEKFSIMLQERIQALETDMLMYQEILDSQNRIIKQMMTGMKICHIKSIFNKFFWQYSNITSSPMYYCKVILESLEMWCKSKKLHIQYNNISLYLAETVYICKCLFPDSSKIRIQPNLLYLEGTEQLKAKTAYIFAMLSTDELIQFDVDDTIPDLVDA